MSSSTPNQFPIKVGKVMSADSLTAVEREAFEKAGWTDNDPIPLNLAEAIHQVQLRTEHDIRTGLPVAPDTPPLEVRESRLADLPPAKQDEIRVAVRAAIEASRMIPEPKAPAFDAPPGVAAALQVAAAAEAKAALPRAEEEPARAPAIDAGATPGAYARCPNCNHDMAAPVAAEPTEDDKFDFLQATLGMLPFRKTVPLLGGAVRVTFRSPTARDGVLVDEQLMDDVRSGRATTPIEFHERRIYYRTALGIELVYYGAQARRPRPVDSFRADLEALPRDQRPLTVLPLLRAHIDEDVVAQEPLRRAVGLAFMRFQALVERLEANTDNGDFWQGIASRG